MGQAKRRRAELGALYGTSEGSNRPPAVQFREMTADEIEALDPQVLAKLREEWGRPLRCVMACCGGETVPLVAAPVIDEAGQFNSYVAPISAWGGREDSMGPAPIRCCSHIRLGRTHGPYWDLELSDPVKCLGVPPMGADATEVASC